jgi:hypothetical protein
MAKRESRSLAMVQDRDTDGSGGRWVDILRSRNTGISDWLCGSMILV